MEKSNDVSENAVTVEFELKARRLKAFRCYARTLRELEDCENLLRDTWASLSAIRSLIQEQTAVVTSSAEIFDL